jgi:alkanesulfonate monooxygenase SsuD/methylene tetrahydromethanopterin reductase-like flavin-dependent oxidoreductase (luciferase family)
VVVVEPGGAGGKGWVTNTGFLRHVAEFAAALVAEEVVGAERGDVDVLVPVVVVVGDGHAHAVDLNTEACFFGDVRERTVFVVAVEGGSHLLARGWLPGLAVNEQNIGPAVVVVIEESAAGAESLR